MSASQPHDALAQKLRAAGPELARSGVLTGFDGIVDEMIRVVESRASLDAYTPVPTIARLGELISASARQSSLREIVVNALHPGGCAVNSGDALASLGIPAFVYATLGAPRLGVFDALARKCARCVSWGEAGRTLAFEFEDGKLMFSNMEPLSKLDTQAVRLGLADGTFAQDFARAGAVLLTDWTLYPHMTDCWALLRKEIFTRAPSRKPFFFDLVDPCTRSAPDICAMLAELGRFETDCGPVHLGLNGSEVRTLARALKLPVDPADDTPQGLGALAARVRETTGIARVIVHRYAFALCADKDGLHVQNAPFCAAPQKSTGAGDRFNAGFILGLLLGETPANCLRLGNACSGFFVRQARSASVAEMADFLEAWARGTLKD